MDLWEKLNNNYNELEKRKIIEKEFDNRRIAYYNEFQKAKPYIPKSFLNIFHKENDFQDWFFLSLSIRHELKNNSWKRGIVIDVLLQDYKQEAYILSFHNIKKYNISYPKSSNSLECIGYIEILLQNDKEKELSFEMLTNAGTDILIHFKKIKLKKYGMIYGIINLDS